MRKNDQILFTFYSLSFRNIHLNRIDLQFYESFCPKSFCTNLYCDSIPKNTIWQVWFKANGVSYHVNEIVIWWPAWRDTILTLHFDVVVKFPTKDPQLNFLHNYKLFTFTADAYFDTSYFSQHFFQIRSFCG